MSIIVSNPPKGYVGNANVKDIFKGQVGKVAYDADFSNYQVPSELSEKFSYDSSKGLISFQGRMSRAELQKLSAQATTQDQKVALKQLYYKSDWEESELREKVIEPITKLRSWVFVLCFLSIGLTTWFKDLATFGMKPFWAFTIGVLINVPLGYFLTTVVFQNYWRFLGQ